MVKSRLMRFDGHNYMYRNVRGEVFRVIRKDVLNGVSYWWELFDGHGDKVVQDFPSLQKAIDFTETDALYQKDAQ